MVALWPRTLLRALAAPAWPALATQVGGNSPNVKVPTGSTRPDRINARPSVPYSVELREDTEPYSVEFREDTELSRKQVASVLDSLSEVIQLHVNKRSVGEFVLPGVLKITTVRKPATKARKGINPFTKEEVMFKAKPASTVVKVRPLKKLKDMVL